MANNYGVDAIQTLEGIEAIRKRPGMYIGSVTAKGLNHIILEIVSNSIDEYLAGACNYIRVAVSNEGFITVRDNGRGIPFGVRADGTEALEAAFTKLHTGAKFNSDGSTGYNSSGGMHGVGAKAANALSEKFICITKRDGKIASIAFAKGEKTQEVEVEEVESYGTGTTISFKPDIEIFKEGIEPNAEDLKTQLKELSYLCKGLKIELKYHDDETIIYAAENGLLDYINDVVGTTAITKPFYCNSIEGQLGAEVAMCYTTAYAEKIKLYTNNIPNSKGTHLTGFRAALTRAINEYARDRKILKEKDENLTGDDLKEGLVLCLSFKMPDPIFDGQTKDDLSSAEGRGIVERLVSKEIRVWLENNPTDAKAIIAKAQLSKKAREAAKKAREATRKKSGSVLGNTVLPGKLADCSSKDVEECEIYLVEGNSAGGSAKQARDRVYQAILPLRGKVLNTERRTLDKILENAEIKAMTTAFGCGIGDNFDITKRRYERIVIMTDADVDGSHIKTLLLTFFYKYMRELLVQGHVFAALPPLYRVVKKNESIYLQDDAELAEYKRAHPGELNIQRFKGLGEMNADQLKETTMDRSKRRMKQITIGDAEKAHKVFNDLMGEAVTPRKLFIEQNAHRANIDV